MTMKKTCSIVLAGALAAALLAVGCSQVLGFKDPRLEDPGNPMDAASDGAPKDSSSTDGPMIDASLIDGPLIDGPMLDASIDGPAGPSCKPADCPFGCDTVSDMCRPGKLWVFLTAGGYVGNGFGGTAVPPAVRAGADARCLQTYSDSFSALQCNPARMHAVLSVNSADDSIGLMASKFSIPTTVEVHRGDDDVLVFNNWNDLTDNTKSPRAPVSTAMDSDADLVWSGFNSNSNCNSWTSAAPTISGVIGHTMLTFPTWLQRASQSCDKFGRLLCVCWSGGQ